MHELKWSRMTFSEMLTYRNKRLDILYITKNQKDFTHHFDWFSLYFAKWTFIYKIKTAMSYSWVDSILLSACSKRSLKRPPALYLELANLKWSHLIPSCYWRHNCNSPSPLPSPCEWWSFRCWRCSYGRQSSPGWVSRYYLTGRKMHRLKKLQPTLAEVGKKH